MMPASPLAARLPKPWMPAIKPKRRDSGVLGSLHETDRQSANGETKSHHRKAHADSKGKVSEQKANHAQ